MTIHDNFQNGRDSLLIRIQMYASKLLFYSKCTEVDKQ